MATATITTGQGCLVEGTQVSTPGTPTTLNLRRALLLPTTIPAAIRKKRITKLVAKVYCKGNGYGGSLGMYCLAVPYQRNAANNIAKPNGSTTPTYSGYVWVQFGITGSSGKTASGGGMASLDNGVEIYGWGWYDRTNDYIGSIEVYPGGSANSPKIEVTYEDAILYAGGVSPAGGWVNENAAVTFSWTPTVDGDTIDPLTQTAAIFRWKNGANGTVHTTELTTETSVTLAAGTLPNSANIMWQVQLTSDDGVQDPSPEWHTITTIEPTPEVKALIPSGSYIDRGDTVTFSWDYIVSTGAPQTAYQIRCRSAGASSWTTLRSASSAATSVEIPAQDIPSGNVEWQVRGANTDGTYSAWSDTLSFICIGPPPAPTVTIKSKTPRPTVAWQSTDQQAFQVRIGDYDSGIIFGTAKSYKCPVYMPNGEVQVAVRVVNDLNLWSDWGTSLYNCSNNATKKPVLTVTGGLSGYLTWTLSSGSPTAFEIIRDGERIATVPAGEGGYSYEDKLAAPGKHTWRVRSTFAANDRYGLSDAKTATVATSTVVIGALDGEWMDIGLSAVETAEDRESRGASVAMLQLAGTEYPTPEIGPQRTHTYTVDFATMEPELADLFEALLGRIVVCKTRAGRQIVGIMASLTRSRNWALTRCSATIQEVDKSVYAPD